MLKLPVEHEVIWMLSTYVRRFSRLLSYFFVLKLTKLSPSKPKNWMASFKNLHNIVRFCRASSSRSGIIGDDGKRGSVTMKPGKNVMILGIVSCECKLSVTGNEFQHQVLE